MNTSKIENQLSRINQTNLLMLSHLECISEKMGITTEELLVKVAKNTDELYGYKLENGEFKITDYNKFKNL